MFISGLTVSMGPPPASTVNEYFDDFQANAVHLWEDGLPTEMNGWANAGRSDFRFVSWVGADGTSHDGGEVLGGYPANAPGRIGYQISDEPRSMDDLLALEAGLTAAREQDPDALLIVNFSYAADHPKLLLTHYGESMDGDVVSFDSYGYMNDAYYRFAVPRETGLAYGMPYWCYLDSYVDVGSTVFGTESDMRWNAFLALTSGYTGFTWFIYQVSQIHQLSPSLFAEADDFGAARTERYAIAAQINEELAHLGRAITQLTSTDVRYISSASWRPVGTVDWEWGAGCDPYITGFESETSGAADLLIGFFVDDFGERYVMVQNVNHERGVYPVGQAASATITVSFDLTAVTDPGFDKSAVWHLDKQTGAVLSVDLTSLGGDLAALEFTLAAGDPYLFKYATGRSFALQ